VEKLMGAGIGFVPLEGHHHLTHDINEVLMLKVQIMTSHSIVQVYKATLFILNITMKKEGLS